MISTSVPRSRSHVRNSRIIASVAAVAVLLAAAPAIAETKEAPDPQAQARLAENSETRIFVLKHLGTKTAITMLRSILQVRQIAEIPSKQTVIVHDRPSIVRAAERLLRDVDVPTASWRAELVLDTSSGSRTLREFGLESENLTLQYDRGHAGNVSVSLGVFYFSATELRVEYSFSAKLHAGAQNPPLSFNEAGEATLADGARLELLRPSLPEFRRTLATVLGLDGEGETLYLRLRRAD